MTLHDELGRLADTAPRPAIDHTVWDRGRALRRRDRVVASGLVLVMVVILGGLASIVLGPPRAFAPADDTVPDGAIPSRIEDVPADWTSPPETDLGIGRVSVVFHSFSQGGVPVVIGAIDGRHHLLDLAGHQPFMYTPVVSPDGRRLAWIDVENQSVRTADLDTGEQREWADLQGINPADALHFSPDSDTLVFSGTQPDGDTRSGLIDLVSGTIDQQRATFRVASGYASPDGSLYAVPGEQEGDAAAFMGKTGRRIIERPLPSDIYPDGVTISPLGWASDSLVLASAEAPLGGYVEGRHLVLFTSPDRPESEWTFRIVARDLPDTAISVAVDLIPDLDGTSNQQLTHDFGEPDWPAERDISWLIGLGVAGALSVLYGLRWLWRRRTCPV